MEAEPRGWRGLNIAGGRGKRSRINIARREDSDAG